MNTPTYYGSGYEIQQGASNPRGVARALVTAIDGATERGNGSAGVVDDPDVALILHQLAFICGLHVELPGAAWTKFYDESRERMEARKEEVAG